MPKCHTMDTKQIFLSELTRRLEGAGQKFDVGEDVISVHCDAGTQTVVRLGKTEYVGLDGKQVSYCVSISKRCLNPDKELFDLNNLGRWNLFTSIFSAIRDEEGIKVFSRLNLYEAAPEVVEHVYAPLAFWAVWLAPGLAGYLESGQPNAVGYLRKVAPKVDPSWFGIPEDAANESPPFNADDFREGVALLRDRGFRCEVGIDGLTVEFPWDPGAVGTALEASNPTEFIRNEVESQSADATGSGSNRTSLLTIETNQPHPLFGKGTLVRLQVPITIIPEKLAVTVNAINAWESEAADTAPFFGSWYIDVRSSSPAYVMFMPTMLWRTITIQTMLAWMHRRHRSSMGYLKRVMRSLPPTNLEEFEERLKGLDEKLQSEGTSAELDSEFALLFSNTGLQIAFGPRRAFVDIEVSDRQWPSEFDGRAYSALFDATPQLSDLFTHERWGTASLMATESVIEGHCCPALRIRWSNLMGLLAEHRTSEENVVRELNAMVGGLSVLFPAAWNRWRLEVMETAASSPLSAWRSSRPHQSGLDCG